MKNKTRQESILRLLIDVDSQRLTPAEAAKKIDQLYFPNKSECSIDKPSFKEKLSSRFSIAAK